jgi:hypothetical protein
MVDSNTRLRNFRIAVQHLIGDDYLIPFVCDGNPYDCSAFLVGLYSTYKLPFSEFWEDDTGFDKNFWLDALETLSLAKLLKPKPVVRRSSWNGQSTIETIVRAAAPVKVLQTNLYVLEGQSGPCVSGGDTSVFEFLLRAIQPEAILLNGMEAQVNFEQRFDCHLTDQFAELTLSGSSVRVAALRHYPPLSRQRAEQWGMKIQRVAYPVDGAPARFIGHSQRQDEIDPSELILP